LIGWFIIFIIYEIIYEKKDKKIGNFNVPNFEEIKKYLPSTKSLTEIKKKNQTV